MRWFILTTGLGFAALVGCLIGGPLGWLAFAMIAGGAYGWFILGDTYDADHLDTI